MKLGDKVKVLPNTTNFPELVGDQTELVGEVEEIVRTQSQTKKGSTDHTRYNVRFAKHPNYVDHLFGFEDHQIKGVK